MIAVRLVAGIGLGVLSLCVLGAFATVAYRVVTKLRRLLRRLP